MAVKVGKPFLLAESAAHGWGVLSHPRVIRVSDNLIVVRYYVGGDNANWDSPIVQDMPYRSPAVSYDGGKTWSYGEDQLSPLLAKYTYYWGWDVSLPDGGSILGRDDSAIRVNRFGEVIEGPWTVVIRTNGHSAGGPWHRGAVLPDGRLVAVSYYDGVDFKGKTKGSFHFVVSHDTGRTWEVVSRVAGPEDVPWGHAWLGFDGPCEASVAGSDRRIICVARTGTKMFTPFEAAKSAIRMLQAVSHDGGKSWKRGALRMEGVYPRLCVMKNGLFVLTYGRPGNHMAFSGDQGRTWVAETPLTPADANTSGYCDVVEVTPGKLLVVFDAFNMDLDGMWLWEPKTQNGLFGVFVNVKKVF